MKRIATVNRAVDLYGPGKDGFKAGVPGLSSPTSLSEKWCNDIQESILNVIEDAGLAPSDDHDQLSLAIKGIFAATHGAQGVGYQHADGVDATTVQAALRTELHNVNLYFIAGEADAKPMFVRALAAQKRVWVPPGNYNFNSSLPIPVGRTLDGDGRTASVLSFSNAGDGLQSTWPINGSTGAYIGVRNLGITTTNAANAGGGFVDVGGTYVDLYNVKISGFKHQIIFDQTEIASVDVCDFGQGANGVSGIWLVNGADHTAGAATGYTNRITVTRSQFNCANGAQFNILDDGGDQHTFVDNNFNGGVTGIRAAGVAALVIGRNESEGHTSEDIYLADTTLAGAYVGPCSGFDIVANTPISGNGGRNITIQNAENGFIRANKFGQAACGINFINGAANQSVGVIIEGNSKLVRGAFRTAGLFVNGNTTVLRRQIIRQVAVTYIAAATAAGSVAITPASMEFIRVGTRLQIINEDGTSAEDTIVRAVTAATFTCTLASAKAVNAVVYGSTPQYEEEGSWTPTLGATGTNGVHAYSLQAGQYTRRGNIVNITGSMTVSAKDAALAGTVRIMGLPFVAENIANATAFANIAMYDGITLAGGYTLVGAIIAPNSSTVDLRKSGSGVAVNVLSAGDIPGATLNLFFSATYTTSAN